MTTPTRELTDDLSQTETTRSSRHVSWTLINFWLDASILAAFLGLVWVTLVIRFVFPPVVEASGWRLWGWDLDQWIRCQFIFLAVFALGVLTHVMLHWSWICGVFVSKIYRTRSRQALPDDGTRTIYGVGILIAILNLLGLLLAIAALTIRPSV